MCVRRQLRWFFCVAWFVTFFVTGYSNATLVKKNYSDSWPYIPEVTRSIVNDQLGVDLAQYFFGGALVELQSGEAVAFVTDVGSCRLLYSKIGSTELKAFGEYGSGDGQFNRPQGIAADKYGNVYVADAGNNRIVKLWYNEGTGSLQFVQNIGESDGLSWPRDVEISYFGTEDQSDDCIYVADSGNGRIIKYTTEGVKQFEYTGLSHPAGVAVGTGIYAVPYLIYVANSGADQAVLLGDQSYSGGSGFSLRASYSVDSNSYLTSVETDYFNQPYFVDRRNSRILKFDYYLEEQLFSFGTRGVGVDQFLFPNTMTIPDGYGGVHITENYTDDSGIQYYWIDLDIRDISVSKSVFNPTISETTELSYLLTDFANVSITITDGSGNTVWKITAFQAGGTHSYEEDPWLNPFLSWDGTYDENYGDGTHAGEIVPDGMYTITVDAEDLYGDVHSEDPIGHKEEDGHITEPKSVTVEVDHTSPQITNVQASNVTPTSAAITWSTNEASDSKVEYGTTTNYGSTSSNGSMVTSHSLSLSGLSEFTTYHYSVASKDASSNEAVSGDHTFKTLASEARNPGFEQVSGSDIVDWETYGSGTFDSSAQHIDGTRSAHLSRTSAAGTFGFSQSYIAVQPNTTYYLGVWVKTQGVSSGAAYAALGVWAEGEANHHTDFGAVSGNSDWTYISDSWTSWANEDRIGIKLYGYSEFVGESMA